MHIPVLEALFKLDRSEGLTLTPPTDLQGLADYARAELGQDLPADLYQFYRAGVRAIGDFVAVVPVWNKHLGWHCKGVELTALLNVGAVPVFLDGCGNLFGLDLASRSPAPAVYFFDHEGGFSGPQYAAGSSLGALMLLLAEHDRALENGRPADWVLSVDPDIDKCARAPAIWRV